MSTTETTSLKEQILPGIESILARDVTRNEKLFAICEYLDNEVDVFDWTGFYFADPSGEPMLLLGPYVGEPTDHTRIPFGKGICGQVAESHDTFVVQDVSEQDNYIACSIHVKSEIVVPIMKGEAFVAQLDIDSHKKDAFTAEHTELLEDICELLSSEF